MAAPSAQSPVLEASTAAGIAAGVLASLSRLEPPFEIDCSAHAVAGMPPARPSGVVAFRFCFAEVPFEARTERRQGRAVLSLRGDFGHLPFTIENARRRRRLRLALWAARRASGLHWEITDTQAIRASGEIDLRMPLTPTAVVAGAVTLLLRSQPYLELITAIAGEP